jgi:nitrogen fixation protein NifT
MKVMLRRNAAGHLSVYVAKKDLEEEVVSQISGEAGQVLTLSNGWELEFSHKDWQEPLQLPQTMDARRLQ